MVVDCDTCQVRGPGCEDCVVSVLLRPPRAGQAGHPGHTGHPHLDLAPAQAAALGVLAASGLIPPLRLVPPA